MPPTPVEAIPTSELETLGLTARVMTTKDFSDGDRVNAPIAPPVSSATRGHTMVVEVLGPVDIAIGPELDAELAEHAACDCSIVLDLRAVPFMDSTGIRILIQARNRARERSLGFVVLASEAVDRTLDAVHLTDYFAPRPALADSCL